jgi:hypothetical protein
VRIVGSSLVLVATLAAFVPGGRAAAAVAPEAVPLESCRRESYVWNGNTTLSGADAIETGIVVTAQLGATLRVVGVSADGIDAQGFATALPVTIAGAAVVPGATIDGGTVSIHGGGGSVPLTVSGATVVIDRCALVSVAAPPQGAEAELPATGPGATPRIVAWMGALSLAAGLVLSAIAQRAKSPAATGGGRERGWRPVAPRPPRG